MSVEHAARRTGLPAGAIERFEAGDSELSQEQIAILCRVFGTPVTMVAKQKPWPMLDLGLVGSLVFLLGGAIPAVAALVAGVNTLRFIDSDVAVARVVGFEHRTRSVEPERGERYNVETVAPLLRFVRPDGGGEVTIAWRETLPDENPFAEGGRVRLIVPKGAPERAETSIAEILVRPFIFAAFAAPLLIVGSVSLRHWRRKREAARG